MGGKKINPKDHLFSDVPKEAYDYAVSKMVYNDLNSKYKMMIASAFVGAAITILSGLALKTIEQKQEGSLENRVGAIESRVDSLLQNNCPPK